MTDELVFPTNDALSMIGDLSSNMMNEDVLAHDINPSFPQTEGSINIPEIIPPIISPKGPTSNFKQTTDQPYAPITQLMKQTEELAATLDGPLNSNINEQINFNHMHSNSSVVQEPLIGQHMPNQLVNNSMNFVNPSNRVPISPVQNAQNTQCLVIGGQRIPISAQSQHTSSVINIKHAPNANSPLIQTCSSHVMHSNSSINTASDMKQTMMVKVPMNQNQNQVAQNPNKPPMKGQIIKTPDQRLMFVTEVNGRRVGYLIQQPKQTNVPQTPVSQIQTTTQNVLNQHFDNRSNQEDSTMNNDNVETANLDKLKCTTSESINFTLDENKEIIMTHSENLTKTTEQPLLKTDVKSLREKLLNLRNPLNTKNQLNLKSCLTFPSMSKHDDKNHSDADMNVDKPTSPSNELPSTTLNANSPLPSPQSISVNDDMDVDNSVGDKTESPEKEDINYEDIEEEEGQEIEFSENDLTAEFDENPIDLPDYQINEDNVDDTEEQGRARTVSTDDEDCMPLSMLRHDNNDGSISPTENNQEDSIAKPKKVKNKKTKPSKEGLEDDLSKKEEDGENEGKAKKKGKSKIKKKKDNRKPKKPIIAYQLFFREVQKDVRAENPQLSFGEISKEVSKKWETLDEAEKKKYHDTHEAAKLEYAEKMKAYKELIAQEKESSVTSPPESPVTAEVLDEENNVFIDEGKLDLTQKKKIKRGKKRKLIKSNDTKEEYGESKEDKDIAEEPSNEDKDKIPGKKLIVKKTLKTIEKKGLDHPPSSPSLPSSASTSDAEEEDSESAITRIRERAAELHKYLKQQRFVVTQKKSKQPGKKARPGKSQLVDGDEAGEIETLKTEDAEVIDKTDVEEPSHMDHKLKICMKEESVNIIVKEKVAEDEVVDHEVEADEDEGTDTADEVKELLVENPPTNIKEDIEEDMKISDLVVLEKTKKSTKDKGPSESKKPVSNHDNDESSEDEKINPVRRKKSSRIKKLEETAARESENESIKNSPGRLRKRKTLKNVSDDTPKSESDDESIQLGRRKSSRKKKLEDTAQSDSDNESKVIENDNIIPETSLEKQDKSKQSLAESNSDEETLNTKQPSIKQKEKPKVPLKEEPKIPVTDSHSPQTEEAKIVTTPAETSLKNTFRIPKKSGSNNENGMMAFRGPRICIRQSCEKPAVTSRERGGQYCGNECLVLFCREVFESWVTDREVEEKNKT